jgi:excisionase family DNA binding protein
MRKKEKNSHDEKAADMSDLISQTEAAQIRGVSRAAISELVKRGRLRSVVVGGHTLLYRADVEAFESSPGWPKGKPRKDN